MSLYNGDHETIVCVCSDGRSNLDVHHLNKCQVDEICDDNVDEVSIGAIFCIINFTNLFFFLMKKNVEFRGM